MGVSGKGATANAARQSRSPDPPSPPKLFRLGKPAPAGDDALSQDGTFSNNSI